MREVLQWLTGNDTWNNLTRLSSQFTVGIVAVAMGTFGDVAALNSFT